MRTMYVVYGARILSICRNDKKPNFIDIKDMT